MNSQTSFFDLEQGLTILIRNAPVLNAGETQIFSTFTGSQHPREVTLTIPVNEDGKICSPGMRSISSPEN